MADKPSEYVVERKVVAAEGEGVAWGWAEVARVQAKSRDEALLAGLGDPKNVKAGDYRVVAAAYIGDETSVQPEVTTTLKIGRPAPAPAAAPAAA